jgi:hypothetical protein
LRVESRIAHPTIAVVTGQRHADCAALRSRRLVSADAQRRIKEHIVVTVAMTITRTRNGGAPIVVSLRMA